MPKKETSDKIAKSSNDRKQHQKPEKATYRHKSQGSSGRQKKNLKKFQKDVDKKRQDVLI